jgi:lantibiotic modifying enzyme
MTAAATTAPALAPSLLAAITRGLHRLPQLLAPVEDISLFTGQLGRVLVYAYAYKLTGEEAYWEHMAQGLDGLLHKLQDPATAYLLVQPGLLPNLGYLLQVLRSDAIVDIDLGEPTLQQFDALIHRNALVYLRAQNIDLLYGAAGALHYLGTRAAGRPQVQEYLRELLSELLANKLEDARGIRFYNSRINQANGDDTLNIGLSHGHCGLLLVLLQLHEAGVLQAELAPLANRMVDYLLSLQLPPEPAQGWPAFFPTRYHEELPLTHVHNRQTCNNHLGWCYGDLNVVQVLYQAHRVLNRPELLPLADRVGEYTAARRTGRDCSIDNPFLCHGSASLVLYYRRLYALRPLPCYLDAHRYWWQRTQQEVPAAFALPSDAFQVTSLLMGVPGLLLVLISEALEEPLAWPQLLLL